MSVGYCYPTIVLALLNLVLLQFGLSDAAVVHGFQIIAICSGRCVFILRIHCSLNAVGASTVYITFCGGRSNAVIICQMLSN